jgi:hypothetical protein
MEVQGELIYIAKRLSDAQQLEAILQLASLEYTVEPDTYQAGLIFRAERIGAFFYVAPEDRERAAALLTEHGFRPLNPEP